MTPPKKTRQRTYPARCTQCGKEMTELDAFSYGTVRKAATLLLEALDAAEPGKPDTAWNAIGVAKSKAEFLIARAEKRCVLCELTRQREADKP